MPWSPVIKEIRVDRPDEGLAGVARSEDDDASTPTRNSFDTGKAAGTDVVKAKRTIDTTQTSGSSRPYDITDA